MTTRIVVAHMGPDHHKVVVTGPTYSKTLEAGQIAEFSVWEDQGVSVMEEPVEPKPEPAPEAA